MGTLPEPKKFKLKFEYNDSSGCLDMKICEENSLDNASEHEIMILPAQGMKIFLTTDGKTHKFRWAENLKIIFYGNLEFEGFLQGICEYILKMDKQFLDSENNVWRIKKEVLYRAHFDD